MFLILLGLLLWTWPHNMKSLTPGLRAQLGDKTAPMVTAIASVLAIVLMVLGYRGADDAAFVYAPPAWGQHANNLLALIAVFLLALGHSKSRLRGKLRHPMLSAVILWAIAHLLVRGDAASLLLWGGLIAWALLSMMLINRRVPHASPYTGGSLAGDIRLVVISLVVFAVVVLLHGWLGPNPLPM